MESTTSFGYCTLAPSTSKAKHVIFQLQERENEARRPEPRDRSYYLKEQQKYNRYKDESRDSLSICEKESRAGRFIERNPHDSSVTSDAGNWFSVNNSPQPRCVIRFSTEPEPITQGEQYHVYRPVNSQSIEYPY